jgi:hypothetical protein
LQKKDKKIFVKAYYNALNMYKKFFCRLLVGFLCLSLGACLDQGDSLTAPAINPVSGSINYYNEVCAGEPYYQEPIWCNWQAEDKQYCCVWLVAERYEEWCQWGNEWCWDHNGSW